MRLFHALTWLAHAGFLYVDDLFMFQDAKVMPISASMIAILCQMCCIPVSWKKCELGGDITWIGWRWHISAGVVSIPHAKLHKLRDLLFKLHGREKTSKKYIEQFLGLATWITQVFPSMRTWLHSLYRDLYAIPATQFSVDPDQWNLSVNCLSDQLIFEKRLQVQLFLLGVAWFRCVINMSLPSVTLVDASYLTNAFGCEFAIQLLPKDDYQYLL